MFAKRIILAATILAAGACSTTPPPQSLASAPGAGCASDSLVVAFDFEGAPAGRCIIDGERAFTVLVEPEHAPPINPSPWFAFRYSAAPGSDVSVTLRYDGADHRYPPELRGAGQLRELPVTLSDDEREARFTVPAGDAFVTAQELFLAGRYEALMAELAARDGVRRLTLGESIDGHPVEALHMGDPVAPHLIVLLGRAHPPEVSGAVAMESFLQRIGELYADGTIDPGEFQVIAVPLLNPDGVARGHWRANLGELDLNRDWGHFTQPETQAVKAWLDDLPESVRPAVMLDFHSTNRNLFYVQGADETSAEQEEFLADWLVPLTAAYPGYEFTIERRNANPGSGTSKNWFNEFYDIPAYTYEAADEVDREAAAAAARGIADAFIASLQDFVG